MKIIGHRGAKGLAPENTLASLRKALEHHVDEIELDVRVTRDGVAVLNHDISLSDHAGNHLVVHEHGFKELLAHKPDLATLDEAIRFVNHRVPIVIELKRLTPVKPVIAVLEPLFNEGWRPNEIHLSSYSQEILLELHAVFPEVQKIPIENWSGVRATRRARALGSRRISMLEIWLWPGFIASIRHGGYELYCFPNKTPHKERFFTRLGLGGYSNTPRKARRWSKYGLTGVITDHPDRFEKR